MENNQTQYPLTLAGQKIDLPSLLTFETQRNHSLSNKIISRLKDLENEYSELKKLYEWNLFVESFDINLQVRLNQDYYLYESNNRKFLSIIPPNEMFSNFKYHGKTKLHSDGFFIKIT